MPFGKLFIGQLSSAHHPKGVYLGLANAIQEGIILDDFAAFARGHQKMRKAFVIAVAIVAASAGCSKFKPWKPPAKPCSDPVACIKVERYSERKCQYPFQWNTGNAIRATNTNPSQTVILTYREQVRHINQVGRGNQSIDKNVRVPNNASEILGCEVTGSNQEQYDIWSYAKLAACFESGNCVVSKPSPGDTPTDVRARSCVAECASNGKFCLNAKFDHTKPEEAKLSKELFALASNLHKARLPIAFDLTQLTDAISKVSSYECHHGPLTVNSSLQTTSSGGQCWLGVNLGLSDVSSIDLNLPSVLDGMLQRASRQFTLNFPDPVTAPTISIFDQSNPPQAAGDEVSALTGNATSILIETKKTYCLKISPE